DPPAIAGDDVPCARGRAADGVVGCITDIHANTVGERARAVGVSADVVALHQVARRLAAEQKNPIAVAGDDVPRARGRAPNNVRCVVDENAYDVSRYSRTGGVRADKVGLEHVVAVAAAVAPDARKADGAAVEVRDDQTTDEI